MSDALAAHDNLIRAVVERHGGIVFKHTGDGLCAVVHVGTRGDRRGCRGAGRSGAAGTHGLNTGEAEWRDGDYFGPTLNRTARLMDAGHGGQCSCRRRPLSRPRPRTPRPRQHHLKGLDTPSGSSRSDSASSRRYEHHGRRRGICRSSYRRCRSTPRGQIVFDELADYRLVTLIGVGGTGKTRLAVETATTCRQPPRRVLDRGAGHGRGRGWSSVRVCRGSGHDHAPRPRRNRSPCSPPPPQAAARRGRQLRATFLPP